MRGLLLKLAVGATLLSPAAAQSAPLRNGDFARGPNCDFILCEEGAGSTVITDWTVLSGNVDYLRTYWHDPTGGGNIDLDGDQPGGLGQSFSTKTGQSYRIDFYMSGNPSPHYPYDIVKTMKVTAGTFADLFHYDISTHGNSDGDMKFVATSSEFTAASNSTALSFVSRDNGGSYVGPVIGDVTVTPLPVDGKYQIHTFMGAAVNGDGAAPSSHLINDAKGVLYGTTASGGANQCADGAGCGTMFSLTPNADATAWTEQTLYSFTAQDWSPAGRLTYDKTNGLLYGTTLYGGSGCGGAGCGAVFSLTAPGGSGAVSAHTVIYQFQGGTDGALPDPHMLLDPNTGALYGVTRQGGGSGCGGAGCGVVFVLTPPASGATAWTETVLYRFSGGNDGAAPIDINWNRFSELYGTTIDGGSHGKGVVFRLKHYRDSWKETVLHAFAGGENGAIPGGGVIIDKAGALYGVTSVGGNSTSCAGGCGAVYRLTPTESGPWKFTVLHRFDGHQGADPEAKLSVKSESDFTALYGTTAAGGSANCTGGCGVAYKLTAPAGGAGAWTETVVHDFTGGSDGATPQTGLYIDAAGHLIGTTAASGPGYFGTAFQLPAQ